MPSTPPKLPLPASAENPTSASEPEAPADAPEVLARVREEMSLVQIVARQLGRQLGGRVMLDDLVSFGQEGLLTAARSFDPSLGVPFRRWANYRVRGAMLDGVRRSSALPRSVYLRLRALEGASYTNEQSVEDGPMTRPTSPDEADARVSEYLAGIATAVALGLLATPASTDPNETVDRAPAADEQLSRNQQMGQVKEALSRLSDQERHMIQRHYFDDVNLDEAARELGLSKSWGSRLHGRAIEALTRQLKRGRSR